MIDPLGNKPQCHLTKRSQIAGLEKVPDRIACALGCVHLPLCKTLEQFFRREANDLYGIGAFEDGIGNGLADHHPGDPGDGISAAFEVLNIERRVDIDAGVQEFGYILMPPHVPAARGVGMGEFIHEHQTGPASEDLINIRLLQGPLAVFQNPSGQDLESVEKGAGLLPPVSLNISHQDGDPLCLGLMCRHQHIIGLPHPGTHPEKDLQPAVPASLLITPQRVKQMVRIGTMWII
jgi:hypothetical protein